MEKIEVTRTALEQAYEMGKDVAKHGPNTKNCHYALFVTKELLEAWENGKRDMIAQLKESQ